MRGADPTEARSRLEAELRTALHRAGVTERAVASVMAEGCRLDGVGAGAVSEQLADAGVRLERRIRELAAALDRLDAGRWGECEACGRRIDPARLDVLPAASRCRRCADDGTGGGVG